MFLNRKPQVGVCRITDDGTVAEVGFTLNFLEVSCATSFRLKFVRGSYNIAQKFCTDAETDEVFGKNKIQEDKFACLIKFAVKQSNVILYEIVNNL